MDPEVYQNFLRDVIELESFQDFANEHYNHSEECFKNFNPLTDLDEKEFMKKYRFSKENMQKVIEFIRDDLDIPLEENQTKERKPQVPVEMQIMAAIRFWGRTEHPLITSFVHGVRLRTLARICRRVSRVLSSKARIHIRMPATLSEKEACVASFQFAKMPSVIGIVDHCSVRFQKQLGTPKIKLNKSISKVKEDKIQVQIIADAQCKIRDIDCRLKPFGSPNWDDVNDTFVQSRIKERFEQNEFRGRFLLGGPNLKSTSYLLTPVECALTHKEMSYNRAHAATSTPAQECLNIYKQRFYIIQNTICSSYTTAKNTIVALAVLHNLAIDWNDRSLELRDYSAQVSTKSNGSGPLLESEHAEADPRTDFIQNRFQKQQ